LFPVFNVVRGRMRLSTCMSNLKRIHQALQMYKNDYGVYPDGLYAVSYAAGGPIDKRLVDSPTLRNDAQVFTCPNALPTFRGNDTLVRPVNRTGGMNAPATNRYGRGLWYPTRSTYDFQVIGGVPELHYALKWTPSTMAGAADVRRQLYFRDPPGDTVVTWCMLHADLNAQTGQPGRGAVVPVLWLINWGGPQYPWLVTK
jgi:hypothetical protein